MSAPLTLFFAVISLLVLGGDAQYKFSVSQTCSCSQFYNTNNISLCSQWTCSGSIDQSPTCFDGKTTVSVYNEAGDIETTLMRHIKIGDNVVGENGEKDIVYAFLHRESETKFVPNMLSICLEDTSCFYVSHDHLLFDNNRTPLMASSVREGTKLLSDQTGKAALAVTSIEPYSATQGIFAPATLSGKIVVGEARIVTSNYATTTLHDAAHAAFAPLRWHYHLFGSSSELFPQEGVHPYAKFLSKLTFGLFYNYRQSIQFSHGSPPPVFNAEDVVDHNVETAPASHHSNSKVQTQPLSSVSDVDVVLAASSSEHFVMLSGAGPAGWAAFGPIQTQSSQHNNKNS